VKEKENNIRSAQIVGKLINIVYVYLQGSSFRRDGEARFTKMSRLKFLSRFAAIFLATIRELVLLTGTNSVRELSES
ncbi:MAG: hypothetical protein ACI8RD_013075, partial [Bacillariaceae sp.]|jgi:hypothetical protein